MSRRRGRVDTQEFASFTRRIMRAYARRAEAGEIDPADLTALLAVRHELDAAISSTVAAIHGLGFSWSDIAQATGTTKQTAHERWGQAARDRQKAVRATLTANPPAPDDA